MNLRQIEPLTRPPDATVAVPGSKSLTNRALVCALLAEGHTTITGALRSDDTAAMAAAIGRLGAQVRWDGTTVEVEGTGGRLAPGPIEIDVAQAGTGARFLLPMLALGRGRYRIDGDQQLRRRPMGPLVAALRDAGVDVAEEGQPGHLPLTVVANGLRGGTVRVAGDVSSQFVSGLLLASPYADGELTVEPTTELVSAPYVEMTRSVMKAFAGSGQPGRYRGITFAVEPDASAASYFFAAAALFAGGRVRVDGLDRSSLQGDLNIVDVLTSMGAEARTGDGWTEVRGTETLRGVDVDMREMPDMAQTLAVVAAFAIGPTTVRGIGFVRGHETDRIAAVVAELQRCGVGCEPTDDGFVVQPAPPRGATVETYGDHRMAMSFALLGLRVPGIAIADPGCVAKTFPDFFEVLGELR